MGKVMISLSDPVEALVRHEVEKVYHGRVGGLSIFFETIIRDHFGNNGHDLAPKKKPRKAQQKPEQYVPADPHQGSHP